MLIFPILELRSRWLCAATPPVYKLRQARFWAENPFEQAKVREDGIQDEVHGLVSSELHAGAASEDASEEQTYQEAGKDHQPQSQEEEDFP